MNLHIVWFKRDLRIRDHQPLFRASEAARTQGGQLLCLYVVEPEYWQQADTSSRQWLFTRECLNDLDQALIALSGVQTGLHIAIGSVTDCLEKLAQHAKLHLYSHEETGNYWTFERDKAVGRWCKQHQVPWQQDRQFGVLRPNPDRDQWSDWREQWLNQPIAPTPSQLPLVQWQGHCGLLSVEVLNQPVFPSLGFDQSPCPGRQAGGIHMAHQLIDSFYHSRGEYYRGSISSPVSAEHHCSRISPYLALGCISLKELQRHNRQRTQQLKQAAKSQQEPDRQQRQWLGSLTNFESRLWWHCHFIQKLEDEPESEWQSLHPAYRNLRQRSGGNDPRLLHAWETGSTGWPLVDACMKYLQYHGWINFRMRAMLMSIACYPLWQDWQQPAQRLAQLFVDYEPGIHYPQAQMQSGATGINVLRMYNPTQQAMKLDPNGVFIRRWLPALRSVPNSFIHQPWLMNLRQQQDCGMMIDRDYPAPVVNFEQAIREARSHLKGLTKSAEFRDQARGIGHKHGSRQRNSMGQNRSRKRTAKSDQQSQLSLF